MLEFNEVAPGILRLQSPFGEVWSGIVLVKGGVNILIDSGADAETVDNCLVPALRACGLEPGDIHWLLNTHTHGDHIGGHRRFRELSAARVATFRGSLDKMRNPLKYSKLIRARFPKFSPPPPPILEGIEPDLLLDDGESVAGRLRLVHTPGHDDDCVSWVDEPTGTLICGDTLQANGTAGQGIGFYQDLAAYRESLRRLQSLPLKNIVTGHCFQPCGALATGAGEAAAYLKECLYLTQRYDSLTAEIRSSGVTDLCETAIQLIHRVGGEIPKYLFLALYTTSEHLKTAAHAE